LDTIQPQFIKSRLFPVKINFSKKMISFTF